MSRKIKHLSGEPATLQKRDRRVEQVFSKPTMEWTTSEQFEEIRELQTNNIALQGSLSRTEKSLDQVTLGLDCGEPFVKRLSQQIRNCRNLWMFHRRPLNLKDWEPANSEVSGLPSTSLLNRNRVSAANVISRNVANYSSRDVFEASSLCNSYGLLWHPGSSGCNSIRD